MIRGRQCHVFVNCHNRSPSTGAHNVSQAGPEDLTGLVLCHPINISASFFYYVVCHSVAAAFAAVASAAAARTAAA